MSLTDPALFYDAALTGANGAALILHDYPMEWRSPMIVNVALTTMRYLFEGDAPTDWERRAAIAMYVQDYPEDANIPGLINHFIDAAFDFATLKAILADVTPEEFASCALMVPPSIAVRYPWKPGERNDYIAFLCTFNHTAFTN
jgi:hypothetical protein